MSIKKLTDQFSADLLNTVSNILGEAKKCKECGCAKCECEDEEDDMDEGYVPTADEPSEKDKQTADKVRALLAKEKKLKKEDIDTAFVEETDSKPPFEGGTTRKGPRKDEYGNTIKNVAKHLAKKAMKSSYGKLANEENDYLETDLKKRKKNNDKAIKDMKNMGSPMKNPAFGEEAEQIDELSKKTLGSYVKKAAGHAAGSAAASAAIASSSNPKVPTKVKRDLRNRMVGISRAADKLTEEEQEFIDALNDEMFEEIEIAEANLKVGDYTASSEKSKFHDKGYRPHLKNPQGKTSYLASVAYKTPEHAAGEAAAYHKGYTSGPGKASERGADDAVRAYRHKNKEHMHEEVEQIEEGLMHDRYMRSHGKKARGAGSWAFTTKQYGEPKEHEMTWTKGKLSDAHKEAAKKLGTKHLYVMEEAEITEARGRPRKENKDYTIHPKTKEKLMHNNPAHMKRIENLQRTGALPKPKTEAGQNIITQLRKASTSMTGGHKVNFTHGASQEVTATHAQKLLDKHAGMKPAEKEDFQKKIGHSHEQLMKHV